MKNIVSMIYILLLSIVYSANANDNMDNFEYQVKSDIRDPYEASNRMVFKFNKAVDKAVLKPVSEAYEFAVPKWGRERVGDALSNLTEPLSFVTNTMTGNVDHAMVNFFRFLINSTVGVFGIMDIASMKPELKSKRSGFDSLFDAACVQHGTYIIIPFIGPSTDREAFAKLADTFTDPVNYAIGGIWTFTKTSANIVQFRTTHKQSIEDLNKLSIDEYVMLRSIYSQKVKNNAKCKKKVM